MNNDVIMYLQYNLIFRIVVLFVFGAIIGSFLNVVIYRLPIMLKRKWHKDCCENLGVKKERIDDLPDKYNLIIPASHCGVCQCKVPIWANIPILGFFLVWGKCYNCKSGIATSYLAVEVITAILFAYVGYTTYDGWIILAKILFLSYVVVAIVIDYKTFLLPDEITLPLLWFGLLVNIHGLISGSLISSVVGAAIGYFSLWFVFWVFKLITRRDGMGFGDFKFLAAILAWVGVEGVIPVLFIAPFLGIIYFLVAYLSGKKKLDNPVPFGPFLGIAAVCVLFFGKYFALSITL